LPSQRERPTPFAGVGLFLSFGQRALPVGEYLNLRSKQNEEAGPLLAEDSDAGLGVDAGKRSSVRKDVAKPYIEDRADSSTVLLNGKAKGNVISLGILLKKNGT